ncbi:DoxX family protein [Granulosicoccaceae sp. 1_MG-2023]|nr:DoxX family protein [Granulosicoccaceae sp. 1_MG-2023]
MKQLIIKANRQLTTLAFNTRSLALLLARLWVAMVFFRSGLTKIQTWDSTLYLFSYEYQVPLLSPQSAAVLGTAAELILPVLLVLGLGGRLSAGALFLFNIVAVLSYPGLNQAGINQHVVWGMLLLLIFAFGPGRWSLDTWLARKLSGGAGDPSPNV